MKDEKCLTEEELTLHYYGELPSKGTRVQHLADCPHCAIRFTSLENDLAKLPEWAHVPDALAGVRMAARVGEKLNRRKKKWLPVLGASSVTAFALVATIALWSSPKELQQTVRNSAQTLTITSINEDMPEIDFLEDLELLIELELLSQIEGV